MISGKSLFIAFFVSRILSKNGQVFRFSKKWQLKKKNKNNWSHFNYLNSPSLISLQFVSLFSFVYKSRWLIPVTLPSRILRNGLNTGHTAYCTLIRTIRKPNYKENDNERLSTEDKLEKLKLKDDCVLKATGTPIPSFFHWKNIKKDEWFARTFDRLYHQRLIKFSFLEKFPNSQSS